MRPRSHPASSSEDGFLLVAVIVMVALILLALAVAAPVVAKDLRRDKEVESMHRAEQYVRAIRLYQRKFPNQYPGSIEALEKSNNIRFLRKQYIDPLTGKADWRLIHVGQNQTTVKGFFGEPLGGLDTKGIGGGLGSASSMQSNIGTTGTSTNQGCNAANSAFCDQKVTTSNSGGGSSTSSSSTSNSGGGLIMGVGSSRHGESILTPNQQTTYDTWEFLYDPRIELLYAKSNILGGGIGSSSATGLGNNLSPTNGLNNNSPAGTYGKTPPPGGSTSPPGPR